MDDRRRKAGMAREEHPTVERLEEYLEGVLLNGEKRALAAHLATCGHCSRILASCATLWEGLDGLTPLAPPPDLAERVIVELRPELEARRKVVEAVSSLGHLEPKAGFSEAVMTRVRAARAEAKSQGAWERAAASAGADVEARILDWVRDPRRLFAALGGIAIVPVAAAVAVLLAVIDNPQLSFEALGSFARWKWAELGTWASGLLEGSLSGFAPGASASGEVLGLVALLLAVATTGSVWILYRTLSAAPLTRTVHERRVA